MASTFTSTEAASTHAIKDTKAGTVTVVGRLTTTVAPVINDVYQMCWVPKGARIVEVVLSVTDGDGAAALLLSVGDGAVLNRFIASSVIGQTGGTVRKGQGITTLTDGFTYLADDTIDINITAAPGTPVAAVTFELVVMYVTDAAAFN